MTLTKNISLIALIPVLLVGTCLVASSQPVISPDFYCEVMTVQGSATLSNLITHERLLSQGDLLRPGDEVSVKDQSYVDLTYDREWKNITRIGANSTIAIHSIYPTNIELKSGDIFARLDDLPKSTTFEIQTPVAVTAVRGSMFWTQHQKSGTQVQNFSKNSRVYVFGLDAQNELLGKPELLKRAEKTSVLKRTRRPGVPKKMSKREMERGKNLISAIRKRVKKIVSEGRKGKTPDIGKIKEMLSQKKPASPSKPKFHKKLPSKLERNSERKNEELRAPPSGQPSTSTAPQGS